MSGAGRPSGGSATSRADGPSGASGSGTDGLVLRLAHEGRLEDLADDALARLLERRPVRDDSEAAAGPDDTPTAVREIIADVRTRGDSALLEMARRFDGVDLDALEVPRARWARALEALDPDVRRALERAARNIDTFHRAQVPEDVEVETEPGVRLGRRFAPLERVGVYAPGGRAAYPSSVLMGVVPARAAGVGEVIVCSPPAADGDEPPAAVLAAAAIGGADRLFQVGGAGAVAAMAYGTATVPRCGAVVGPGNRWVLEAKRQVAGEVVIDSPAGPSEVLVVVEPGAAGSGSGEGRETTPALAELAAAELVAQAEHDPDAAVVLVTPSAELLADIRKALARQAAATPRAEIVRQALAARGALLQTDDLAAALAFADRWAPEHLALYTRDPARDLERVRTAGTAFLGAAASVAHGDYLTGANHVLPTAGTARSFSGLSALHFMRSYTWQEIDDDAAGAMADDVERLADAEALPAHGAAARLRAAAEGARQDAQQDAP